jgi:hypothetical protein
MKLAKISIFLLGIGLLHASAFADIYECSTDGYCHDNVATEGDIGPCDDSYCGAPVLKLQADQTCHQFSPCGADEGKVNATSCAQ